MTVITLYYYEEENFFVMDEGEEEIVYDIFNYCTPNQLRMFKEKRGTYYIHPLNNPDIVYELMFPLYDDEDYYAQEVNYGQFV